MTSILNMQQQSGLLKETEKYRYNVSSSSSLYNYVTVNFPCLLNWNAHGSPATPPWVWLGWWVWFSTLFDFYSGGNTAVSLLCSVV